jgi:hypothetical protein
MAIEIKLIWSLSSSIYKVKSFQEEIDGIYRYIRNIYSDISDSHINSAKQAIRAAENSQYFSTEILDAISHLRDAYNVSESALYKTREKKVLFVFTKRENLISDENKYLYYQSLGHIAGIISILYKTIGQSKNSIEWKQEAFNDYRNAINIMPIDYDSIQSINTNYVETYEEEGVTHGSYDGSPNATEWITKQRLTSLGDKFYENQKEKMLKKFELTIDEKSLRL